MPGLWERHIRVDWGAGGFSAEFEWHWPSRRRRYLEFEATFEKDGTQNTASLSVWNLSDDVLARYYEVLRQAGLGSESEEREMQEVIPYMRIYAGWGEDPPLIFTGKIEKLPESYFAGGDKITVFSLVDDEEGRLPRWRCPGSRMSFPPGTPIRDIIETLIAELGLPLGAPVEPGVNYPVKEGRSFGPDTPIREALRDLAQETESEFYVVNSHVYFVPADYGIPTGLTLNRRTGLIWIGRPIHYQRWAGTEELVFTALIHPLLTPGAIVTVADRYFTGTVRIEGVHIQINRSAYYAECRCIVWDETAAREARREKAREILRQLQRGRDPRIYVPLQLDENFNIWDPTPYVENPPPRDREWLEWRPDAQDDPYWDFERHRWVDPKLEREQQ